MLLHPSEINFQFGEHAAFNQTCITAAWNENKQTSWTDGSVRHLWRSVTPNSIMGGVCHGGALMMTSEAGGFVLHIILCTYLQLQRPRNMDWYFVVSETRLRWVGFCIINPRMNKAWGLQQSTLLHIWHDVVDFTGCHISKDQDVPNFTQSNIVLIGRNRLNGRTCLKLQIIPVICLLWWHIPLTHHLSLAEPVKWPFTLPVYRIQAQRCMLLLVNKQYS